jgi:serine/threonine protein kinase
MFCSRCGTEVQVSSRFCPACGQDLSSITQGVTASQPAAPTATQATQPDEVEIVREALKDEYELEKELGRGGMAIVFKARDKALDREVAIKVLPFSFSFDAEFVERFQREARTSARLEHPNIIPIYRVGKSGRVIYFVMKFVRGKTLSAVIEARGAIPVPELRRLMIECARALGFAHRHAIVHRDIKPDNIMFDELGQAIVMDFGIAKAQSGARLTGTGMSIGTPHYMSPEQARAQTIDGRSDLYSLGVVAYQCLTGHVPFDGEDSFSIGYKHIMDELPVPPLEHADQRELFAVIQRMMAKKQEDRYQSADDLVHALEQLGGAPSGASVADMATMPTLAIEPMKAPPRASLEKTTPLPRASGPLPRPAEATAPTRPSSPAAPLRPRRPPKPAPQRRSRAPVVVLGLLVVAAAAVGAYLKFGPGFGTQVALQPAADTALAADSSRASAPPDTAAAQPPGDTGTAHAASATEPPATTHEPAASTREPARPEPPRTEPTPRTAASPRTEPARAAAPPPRTTQPPGGGRAGAAPTGNLMISGNIPPGARVMVDGVAGGTFRVLPVGRHRIRIEAPGYRPYDASVDIHAGQGNSHPVTMLSLAAAAPPRVAGPQAAAGPPPAQCAAMPSFGVRNPNHECYTNPPVPRADPVVMPPASCSQPVTPARLLIKVSATGGVELSSVQGASNCPAFDALALSQANDMAFTPATKNGTPVIAWIHLPFRPAARP